MFAAKATERPVRRVAVLLVLLFAAIGIVLIVCAQWENFHNQNDHSYWPFIDLFPLFLVGCGFIVLAAHPLVWESTLTRGNSVPRSRVALTAVVLVVTSIPATVVVALVIGFIASLLPR